MYLIHHKNKSKEESKDQELIKSNTTPDPARHIGKWQNTRKHHTYKRARSSALPQQVTTRLQGIDKTVWQTWSTNDKNDPQKEYRLGTVSKNILLEGLNLFDGANLTLISYSFISAAFHS